jgi:hypothetical protein
VRVLILADGMEIDDTGYDPGCVRGRNPGEPPLNVL